jgi:hypothetical protein
MQRDSQMRFRWCETETDERVRCGDELHQRRAAPRAALPLVPTKTYLPPTDKPLRNKRISQKRLFSGSPF